RSTGLKHLPVMQSTLAYFPSQEWLRAWLIDQTGCAGSGWTAARSFSAGQIIEAMEPLSEPRGQTVRWHALGQLGRGEQLPQTLTPSQGLTEFMGDFRSGLQNGREVILG